MEMPLQQSTLYNYKFTTFYNKFHAWNQIYNTNTNTNSNICNIQKQEARSVQTDIIIN